MICLTLSELTLEANVRVAKENRKYIDICELRIDLLDPSELPRVKEFPSQLDIPVILTYRRVQDGGRCTLPEKQRRAVLIDCLDGNFAYVDIEDDVKKNDVELKARQKGTKVIRSLHDFQGVPEDIFSKVHSLAARGDVAKIAATPHNLMDILTLFRINEELKDTPKIVIGMGDWGVCTRILYKKIGSILTFGCAGEAVAPGQVSIKELKELYRADQVSSATWVYGIVGNPVMHTASPLIHNLGFHKIKFNAIYVPFQAESIRSFLLLAEYLRLRGFSVTVPYKVDILSYLGNITREVKQIGSCNTVVRVPNMWKGTNTDYYGFLAPIEKDIDRGKVKNALVIGAGGAAQAIVWALKSRGIKVVILNRSKDKAETLARRFGAQADTLSNQKKYEGWADLVVQTTSLGLAPNENTCPLTTYEFTGKEIAYDIVYKPKMTLFLKKAEAKGCDLRFGAEMLLEQGKLQFEAFSGYYYPTGLNPLD